MKLTIFKRKQIYEVNCVIARSSQQGQEYTMRDLQERKLLESTTLTACLIRDLREYVE
ncbi:hypothetical protein J6590_080102 [Homalodisca vitripennis]|nr:hypothetical protein J6590_080102 [Homalodisca vitripennis]